jgi:hypothetical protein
MATSAGLAWSLNNGISQAQYDQSIADAYAQAQAKGLTDAQIESNMNQYGVSAADVARATKLSEASLQARLDAATPTTPAEIAYNQAAMAELAGRQSQWDAAQAKNVTDWAAKQSQNVTDWAAQQKANEAAWALKQQQNTAAWAEQQRLNAIKNAQQIAANEAAWAAKQRQNEVDWAKQQSQTLPFANATQGFEQNFRNYQSIAPGAQYDPSVTGGASPYSKIMGQMNPLGNPYANVQGGMPLGGYNPGLYDRINAANVAKALAASTAASTTLNDVNAGGGDGGDGGGGGATGGGGGGAMAKGGYVHGGLMFGPNPPGPDDGAVNLDMGEYVIKKSSVDKYGRGLLDMINEGKVPAKKLKSLLG